jgi:hypothetical protein
MAISPAPALEPYNYSVASETPDRSAEPARSTDDEPTLYCPRCSARLQPHRCKLVCERCGYFMSCAEYH